MNDNPKDSDMIAVAFCKRGLKCECLHLAIRGVFPAFFMAAKHQPIYTLNSDDLKPSGGSQTGLWPNVSKRFNRLWINGPDR